MKSIHIRGWIQSVTNTSSVDDIGRMVVYYDSQPNGAAPLIAQLLQDSNAGAGTSYNSEINLANRQRFKILRDHIFKLPALVNSAAGVITDVGNQVTTEGTYLIDMFIKLKGLEAVFNGVNGGTVADIQSGAIGFAIFDAINNNSWVFNFTTRLRYYD